MKVYETHIVNTLVHNLLHDTQFFLPLVVDFWLKCNSLEAVLETLLFEPLSFEIILREHVYDDIAASSACGIRTSALTESACRELLISSACEETALRFFGGAARSQSFAVPARLLFPYSRTLKDLVVVLLVDAHNQFAQRNEDVVARTIDCRGFRYNPLLEVYINRELLFRWSLYYFILNTDDRSRVYERRQGAWLVLGRIFRRRRRECETRSFFMEDFSRLLYNVDAATSVARNVFQPYTMRRQR